MFSVCVLGACGVVGRGASTSHGAHAVGGPPPPVAKDLSVPPGVVLVTACTPTGPEICFDATDNNCNGVIDEGCGVHTGVLQFAIAWDDGPDVDLRVVDPGGELVQPNEETASGLRKDRDCGAKDNLCHGQNLENVYFDGDVPPPGLYRVSIKVERANESEFPVKVHFAGRVGLHVYGMDLSLGSKDDEKVFTFTL